MYDTGTASLSCGGEKRPASFREAAERIAKELVDLLCDKQREYGHNNILKFGELGVIIRVSDKIERLITLNWREDQAVSGVKFESQDDTFRDLANYSIIGLMLRRNWFTLPLE